MIPSVEGVITADEVQATAAAIAALQLPDGMIPWYPGGHCDPWNHVETAMALDVAGRHQEAAAAYRWLAGTQRRDGSWHSYYVADGVEDTKLDTNVCAYVATGVWHHWLITRDEALTAELWPVVAKATDWVLQLQTRRGEVIWAREVDRRPWSYALLTGCSSIAHSLECAVALADLIGENRPDWELSLVNLTDVLRTCPGAFADKSRWAMDWYYPVLTGVLTGDDARQRLADGWDTFVMAGRGVRCVSNEPWVTAAETAECALAHLAVGEAGAATDLLRWTRAHRCPDGAYLTGLVYPQQLAFPGGERTAYTGAAIMLAADALSGATAASDLFVPASALADDPDV